MFGKLMYLPDVVTLKLDESRCTGCGTCLDVCPHRVFAMIDGSVSIAERDLCMECGACARNCPVQAISVNVGVGCAAAVINTLLGRTGSGCCCVVEDAPEPGCGCSGKSQESTRPSCC
jgi:NAD-dependent dihydropyrimidine dehydrogenase PreA subunit